MTPDGPLTLEERATNYETMRHIERVRNLLNDVIRQLLERAERHDQSKLDRPEVEAFTQHTATLATTTYGSPEYDAAKRAMSQALAHHYAHNRHHSEHHRNGIQDMTLIDLLEMLVDWKAASERHNDGNILKSIEINALRFNIGPDIARALQGAPICYTNLVNTLILSLL